MSRPFDSTNDWWRDELKELAQIVHQLHLDREGTPKATWRTCPMASCSRIRAIIEESKTGQEIMEFPVEDVISIVVRKRTKS